MTEKILSFEATENAVVLVLSGEQINESIAAHGPFVMNTKEEFREAFEEFNNGKFGHLANQKQIKSSNYGEIVNWGFYF